MKVSDKGKKALRAGILNSRNKLVQLDPNILQPPEYQIVKDLLEVKNKIVGYMTGISIYNKLGLTTQVSNTIFDSSVKRIPSQKIILICFRYWML